MQQPDRRYPRRQPRRRQARTNGSEPIRQSQTAAELKRKAEAARTASAPVLPPAAPSATAAGAGALPGPRAAGAPSAASAASSPPLAALAGVYAAGTVDFTLALRADGVLTSSAPGQPVVELVPAGDLRFTVTGAPGFSAEFRRDASGAVNDVLVHQPNGSALAVRMSGERLDPKIMASLAGEYEIGSAVLTVRVQGNGLTYLVPGQPVYKLVYAHGLRFSVPGIAGVSIEFLRDSSGQVTGLVSRQADGDFHARRRGARPSGASPRVGSRTAIWGYTGSGGRNATVPVTNFDGFTVDVPASWQISRVGRQLEARSADGLAFCRYGRWQGTHHEKPASHGGTNSMYTPLDHPLRPSVLFQRRRERHGIQFFWSSMVMDGCSTVGRRRTRVVNRAAACPSREALA